MKSLIELKKERSLLERKIRRAARREVEQEYRDDLYSLLGRPVAEAMQQLKDWNMKEVSAPPKAGEYRFDLSSRVLEAVI